MSRTATLPIMTALAEYSDAQLVVLARQGQADAFSILFERWFDRVWNVARNILRDADLASEATQDTFCVAWKNLDQLRDPEAFGGWLLRSGRNQSLNKLQKEKRSKSESGDIVSDYQDHGYHNPVGGQPVLAPDKASENKDQQNIVWAATAALGERDASIVDLHVRYGLGPAELAEELGVTANNAHQLLFRLKNKLGDIIGYYLLWRDGQAACDGLAAAVSGAKAFDKSVSQAIKRHQNTCDDCSQRRAAMVSPTQLFASVPLVAAPLALKAKTAEALQIQGVPVQFDTGQLVGDNQLSSSRSADQFGGRNQPPDAVAGPERKVSGSANKTGNKASVVLKTVAGMGVAALVLGLGWMLLNGKERTTAADTSGQPETTVATTLQAQSTARNKSQTDSQSQTSVRSPESNSVPTGDPPVTSAVPQQTTRAIGEGPTSDSLPGDTDSARPEVKTKAVPNVVERSQERATVILEKAEFTVKVKWVYVDTQAPEIDRVVAQDPAAGTELPVGSEVVITVERSR